MYNTKGKHILSNISEMQDSFALKSPEKELNMIMIKVITFDNPFHDAVAGMLLTKPIDGFSGKST